MPGDKGKTLKELADGLAAKDPRNRKGQPSEGVTANAAANAMHAGGATGLG